MSIWAWIGLALQAWIVPQIEFLRQGFNQEMKP